MKGAAVSRSLGDSLEESEYGEQGEETESEDDVLDDMAENAYCMILHRAESSKKGEQLSSARYKLWREEQKTRAARLQKELKARWYFLNLIQEQLNRFNAHYNCPLVPTRLKHITEFLMPKWAPPHELTALTWIGEWRPSAMLNLLCSLAKSSRISRRPSSLEESNGIDRILSQVINEVSIDEAVIDSQMAEIQATCVLHLPFAPLNNLRSGNAPITCIQAEFEKIERVMAKAQQLRFKALDLAFKMVLTETDAAEFLVAFVGIQDLIHHFAEKQKLSKLPARVPVKSSARR